MSIFGGLWACSDASERHQLRFQFRSGRRPLSVWPAWRGAWRNYFRRMSSSVILIGRLLTAHQTWTVAAKSRSLNAYRYDITSQITGLSSRIALKVFIHNTLVENKQNKSTIKKWKLWENESQKLCRAYHKKSKITYHKLHWDLFAEKKTLIQAHCFSNISFGSVQKLLNCVNMFFYWNTQQRA